MLPRSFLIYWVSKGIIVFKPESPSWLQRGCWRKCREREVNEGILNYECQEKRNLFSTIIKSGKLKGYLWIFALKKCNVKTKTLGDLGVWWPDTQSSGVHRYMAPLGCWLAFGVLVWLSPTLNMTISVVRSAFGIRCSYKNFSPNNLPVLVKMKYLIQLSPPDPLAPDEVWLQERWLLYLDHWVKQTSVNRNAG